MFYTKFELTQANFLLAQLQMHSLWRAGECLAISFPHQDWGRSYIFFSDFFGKGPIFFGHRSWNIWWWFWKLCWAHNTCFSLFLMSYSLWKLLLTLMIIRIHHYLSNTTDPNFSDHFIIAKMAAILWSWDSPCKVAHFPRKFSDHLRPAKPLFHVYI